MGKFVPETEEMELEGALKRVAGVSGRDCIPDGPRVNDSVDGRKQAAVFECLCHLRGALRAAKHDLMIGHLDEDSDFEGIYQCIEFGRERGSHDSPLSLAQIFDKLAPAIG